MALPEGGAGWPAPPPAVTPAAVHRTTARAATWAVPALLYAVAAALLTVGIGSHPGFAYNWEGYTAWRVFSFWAGPDRSAAAILTLTDGLMTDSGRGPLVGLPVAIGFALGSVSLTALRLPVALVAAAAAPLLWIVGRRLAPRPGVAALAALLLALSPVYLLYGRTATLVGISLVPTLLTTYALIRVLTAAGGRVAVAWLVGLQLCLVGGAYAYAPVRLLWPLSLALLAVEAGTGTGPERRRWLVGSLAVTAVSLPLAVALIDVATAPEPAPLGAVEGYFEARGEQLLSMREAPTDFEYYLRPTPAEEVGGGVHGTPGELALRLVAQNAGDLLRLLLDRETLPTATDYWNARGRLWPALLAPFFWLGLAAAGYRAIRQGRTEDRVMVGLALGLSLPLLLTSRVHVGRLVPAVPFLLLLVVGGWALVAAGAIAGLDRLPRSWSSGRLAEIARRAVPAVLAAAIVLTVGRSTWAERRVAVPAPGEERTSGALALGLDEARERGGAAVVEAPDLGLEIEEVHAATYRLDLDGRYRFVDLTQPATLPSVGDDRPPLYVVGVLDRLRAGDLPNLCGNLYVVAPEAADAFRAAARSDAVRGRCPGPLREVVAPE